MILAHSMVGVILGNYFGYRWFWFVGSVIPDVDHLIVLWQHRIFSLRKIVDCMRFEDRYGLRFKTPYGHSFLGALIVSAPVALFNVQGAFYFFLAYVLHLALDAPDQDEKQYFFPFETTFKGWLPICSKFEIMLTMCLLALLVKSFI